MGQVGGGFNGPGYFSVCVQGFDSAHRRVGAGRDGGVSGYIHGECDIAFAGKPAPTAAVY